MHDLLVWMETSALGQFMRASAWAFPAAEILHFMGLSLLIGSLMVVDLRLLGLAPNIPLRIAYRFLPITAAGFAINAATGTLFLFSDPSRYYPNLAFRIKMLLVLLAALNALWFKLAVHARAPATPDSGAAGATAKVIAALSLALWIGVIVMGRFIPYLEG
jgi:hypothetical protein